MALVPEKIEIVLTEESMKVMKAFSDSVEKFCHAAEELSSALQKSSSRPTKRAGDGATCPRCQGILNNDGYCSACGYPFPPRA